jgi:hypothetical protein
LEFTNEVNEFEKADFYPVTEGFALVKKHMEEIAG